MAQQGKYAQVRAMDQTEPQREIIRSVRGLQEAIETLQPQKRLQELLDALAVRLEPLAQAMARLSEETQESLKQLKDDTANRQTEILKASESAAKQLDLGAREVRTLITRAQELVQATRQLQASKTWEVAAVAMLAGITSAGLMSAFWVWIG